MGYRSIPTSYTGSIPTLPTRATKTGRRHFRDLIRDRLVESAVVAGNVVGTVTLIYDHHTRLLPEKLTDLQHEYHDVVISTLHAHLDHERCLEVVILRGKSKRVQQLADRLISIKGVQHGRLVMSAPEVVSRHTHKHV